MKKSTKIVAGLCTCLVAASLGLCACGTTHSTVKSGSNNDGSKGAAATYKSDNGNFTSAANCALGMADILNDLMDKGYTEDNVKSYYEKLANIMPLDDMGKSASDISTAGLKYEKSELALKALVEPAAHADLAWATVATGDDYQVDLAVVQAAYAAAGGKSTITEATGVRPNARYTFKEDYDGNAAGSSVNKSAVFEGEYFIQINDRWYLFDSNL